MSETKNEVATPCPKGLSAEARRLWKDVCAEFVIETATQRLFLQTACEALDRLRSAQKELKEHGITTSGRYGQRIANPALAVEKSARAALTAALGKIGFGGNL